MTPQQWLEQQAVRNAALKHDLRQTFDPYGLLATSAKAWHAWMGHPLELANALSRYGADLATLRTQAWQRTLGQPFDDAFPPIVEDHRFSDPAWQRADWGIVKDWYLFNTRWLQDMLYQTPGLSDRERRRSAFWLRQWLNAIAPTNFLALNPKALQKAAESRGQSLMEGWRLFREDMQAGDIRMTDRSQYQVGVNLGTTAGAVVYRNDLLEVIHYTPTTAQVRAMPLVLVTPWINKYYILDLTPKKSLVKYLVDQGYNVFITSWKNPTPEMRDISFDDYLTDGIDQIVKVAQTLGHSEQVGLLGYCIGGTLCAMYMAWLNAKAPDNVPVAHWTLLTTLVDFAKPGDIEVFIDEEGLAAIDQIMAKKGYLDGKEMASSFRMLRANSLIWNYWAHNYLLGENPPAMDVLYWNTDVTRLPYAMHRWYLRELYMHNRLIEPGCLTVAGQKIDLGDIRQPLYLAGAQEDHITPWQQTFRLVNLINAPVTYMLSSSGHILGMINPPVEPPKRSLWQGEARRSDTPEQWQERQSKQAGSWWPQWLAWLGARSGDLIAPPPTSNRQYKKLADAPGLYVLES